MSLKCNILSTSEERKKFLPLGMYSLVSRVHFKADTPKGEPLEMGRSIIQSA
jgi:hypothetical protein